MEAELDQLYLTGGHMRIYGDICGYMGVYEDQEPELAHIEVWSKSSKLPNSKTLKRANSGSGRAIEEPKQGKSSSFNRQNDGQVKSR